MEPNLFDYATKELSQDAFFCWLFAWSESKYKGHKLNKLANCIISDIIKENINIEKIMIKQQYKSVGYKKAIDFFLRINDKIVIVFEDKTESTEHDDQLKNYRKMIEKDFPNDKRFFVYIKSNFIDNQERKMVENYGFTIIFDINKIVDLLKSDIDNTIYKNYYSYISDKKNKLEILYQNEGFYDIKIDEWGNTEWNGFANKLSKTINHVEYRHNTYGSAWWFSLEWIQEKDFPLKYVNEVALQIDDTKRFMIKFVFNESVNDDVWTGIVNEYREKLIKIFNDRNIIRGDNRGKKRTVLIIFKDFLKTKENKKIDFQKTVDFIEEVRKKYLIWINVLRKERDE